MTPATIQSECEALARRIASVKSPVMISSQGLCCRYCNRLFSWDVGDAIETLFTLVQSEDGHAGCPWVQARHVVALLDPPPAKETR